MFTGLVSDVGEIVAVSARAEGLRRLKIACNYRSDSLSDGASIACAGVCLTVVGSGKEGDRAWFSADAAAETLRLTMQKIKLCLGYRRSAGRGLSPGRPAESELRL